MDIAAAATLLGFLIAGFGVYLLALSGLQEEHFQAAGYKTFSGELATATAPIGSAPDGVPVAVITIPAIGLRDTAVVEGTTGRDLMRGPGHRRDTALPGQTGVAVVFGRRVSFGAPFAALNTLRVGDRIYATTGQGKFVYTVNAFGDGSHPILDTATARLVLVTADSGRVPHSTLLVGARLDGQPQTNPGGRPAIIASDHALASDNAALPPLQLWSLALLAASALATVAVGVWNRWAAYLATAPVILALAWSVYENVAAQLPNLY
jgi:sortase A